jgi:Tol biopolymer transport system component
MQRVQMRILLLVSLCTSACGSVGSSDGGTGGAAGSGGSAGGSATGGSGGGAGGSGDGSAGSSGGTGGLGGGVGGSGGVQAACDKQKPFAAPVIITSLMAATQTDSGWMSPDGLQIYVAAVRTPGGVGGYDIFRASRASAADPFGALTALPNVNTANAERTPILSPDRLTLIFESDRVSGNSYDLYVATRTTVQADFGAPALLAGVNTTSRDDPASLSADGKTLYFNSDRPNGLGADDIYTAIMDSSGAFGNVRNVAELNSAQSDGGAVISADGLTVYFASNRPGGGTSGSNDIYMARRSTIQDGFGQPVLRTELNSAGLDYPAWISADECTLLMGSDKRQGALLYDLYTATRPR